MLNQAVGVVRQSPITKRQGHQECRKQDQKQVVSRSGKDKKGGMARYTQTPPFPLPLPSGDDDPRRLHRVQQPARPARDRQVQPLGQAVLLLRQARHRVLDRLLDPQLLHRLRLSLLVKVDPHPVRRIARRRRLDRRLPRLACAPRPRRVDARIGILARRQLVLCPSAQHPSPLSLHTRGSRRRCRGACR